MKRCIFASLTLLGIKARWLVIETEDALCIPLKPVPFHINSPEAFMGRLPDQLPVLVAERDNPTGLRMSMVVVEPNGLRLAEYTTAKPFPYDPEEAWHPEAIKATAYAGRALGWEKWALWVQAQEGSGKGWETRTYYHNITILAREGELEPLPENATPLEQEAHAAVMAMIHQPPVGDA